MSVLFCDVAGSTALGERLDPEAQRAVMGRFFAAMRHVVERHGGLVEKFIGDAVMAVFGIPVVREDDALRAVRAAVEMQQTLQRLGEELEASFGVRISARIGVNTGEVIVAGSGAGDRVATGDAVNVAARLEQAAEAGQVLVGKETFGLVRDVVTAEPVPPLVVKGKSAPLRAWRVTGVPAGTGQVERVWPATRFVGRGRELRLLADCFARCREEAVCELVTVLGAGGAGKTRLAEEFLASLGPGVTVLRSRCLSYGEGVAFWPVRELVRQAAGLDRAGVDAAGRGLIAAVVGGDRSAAEVAAALAPVAGLGGSVPEAGDLRWAVRRFVEALARRRPLVVVVDDLHWAQESMLGVLDHLADFVRDVPVLLVGLARPELLDAHPAWGGGKLNATTLHLTRLSDAEIDTLLADLLGGPPGPVIRRGVAATAEGNPLFVEQMLALLREQGRITTSSGAADVVSGIDAGDVPGSIRALLAARLDGLDPDQREVLQRAAVVGQVFYPGAVVDLADSEPGPDRVDVPAALLALLRQDLIHADTSDLPGEDAYRFGHGLIRDAAYAAIPKTRRADLHQRCARWVDTHATSTQTSLDEIVAHHLEQAYRLRVELAPPDPATRALGAQAADRLVTLANRVGTADLPSAAALLGRAADLVSDDVRAARLLARQARLHYQAADFAHARDVAQHADDRAAATADEPTRLLTAIQLELCSAGFSTADWNRRVLQSLADDATARFPDDLELVIAAADAQSLIANIEARFDDVVRWALAGIDYAHRLGDNAAEASFYTLVFNMIGYGTRPVIEGMREIERLQATLPRSSRGWRLAEINRAWSLAMTGDTAAAHDTLATMKPEITERGDPWEQSQLNVILAEVATLDGDYAEAAARRTANIEMLRPQGEQALFSTEMGSLARYLHALGDVEGATAAAAEACATTAPGDVWSEAEWRGVQARLDADAGRFDTALALADQAVDWASHGQQAKLEATAYGDRAYVRIAAGHPDQAIDDLNTALHLWERKGVLPQVQRTRHGLDTLTHP